MPAYTPAGRVMPINWRRRRPPVVAEFEFGSHLGAEGGLAAVDSPKATLALVVSHGSASTSHYDADAGCLGGYAEGCLPGRVNSLAKDQFVVGRICVFAAISPTWRPICVPCSTAVR